MPYAGPVVGTILFGLDGFKLPFLAVGSAVLFFAFLGCFLPNPKNEAGTKKTEEEEKISQRKRLPSTPRPMSPASSINSEVHKKAGEKSSSNEQKPHLTMPKLLTVS